jgi:hypothetical protein
MQDDLEALWKEFFPEAEGSCSMPPTPRSSEALAFLKENCIVV